MKSEPTQEFAIVQCYLVLIVQAALTSKNAWKVKRFCFTLVTCCNASEFSFWVWLFWRLNIFFYAKTVTSLLRSGETEVFGFILLKFECWNGNCLIFHYVQLFIMFHFSLCFIFLSNFCWKKSKSKVESN